MMLYQRQTGNVSSKMSSENHKWVTYKLLKNKQANNSSMIKLCMLLLYDALENIVVVCGLENHARIQQAKYLETLGHSV